MAYLIEVDDEVFELEGTDLIDAVQLDTANFHVLDGSQSYKLEIVSADFNSKSFILKVNGNQYTVTIKDSYDQLVQKMGLSTVSTQKLKNIKAPMPGLIIDILVKPGQAIEKGDQILILEAMKMENVLKAEGEGIVKSILMTKGQAVDKGQVIIEME